MLLNDNQTNGTTMKHRTSYVIQNARGTQFFMRLTWTMNPEFTSSIDKASVFNTKKDARAFARRHKIDGASFLPLY